MAQRAQGFQEIMAKPFRGKALANFGRLLAQGLGSRSIL
jgi:hypothetical protein